MASNESGKTGMFIVTEPADPKIHAAAMRMARRCRYLIQACLREEEWMDADAEFYLVLREELERFVANRAPSGPGG